MVSLNQILGLLSLLINATYAGVLDDNEIRVHGSQSHDVVRRSNSIDPPRVPLIYVTPRNFDEVLNQIQVPTMEELRERKRPFTFFVEGIVGTGKSTLLEPFQKYPLMDILPEPVPKWQNLNGTDLLQLVYDNPKRWAMTQESYVQLTMLEEHLRHKSIVKGMERSFHSARHCFIESFWQSGNLTRAEYAILDQWYKLMTDQESTGFNLNADVIFYLQADPDIVFDRIRKRNRKEESGITYEFLNSLHRLHEDWLIYGNSTDDAKVPAKQIFVINTAPSYDEMMTIYKKLAQKIWYKIPSQMKNRPCWMY